jgi:hypothetical protein
MKVKEIIDLLPFSAMFRLVYLYACGLSTGKSSKKQGTFFV